MVTWVTCKEAEELRSEINVKGRITQKGVIRNVNTKHGESAVCDAFLSDDSGSIRLTLWGEDTEKVKVGNKVSIENAYTTTWNNAVQLNLPRDKTVKLEIIKPVLPLDESPPPDKPPSKGNDETYKPKEDVESLKAQISDLQRALLDFPYQSRSPNKNAKRLTDKKSVENTKSNLQHMDLRYWDLSDAKLSDAKLSDTNLSGADLSGADLSGADLYGAVLYNANLSYAIFSSKTDLSYADLTNTNRRGCHGFDKAKKKGTVGLDLKKTGSTTKGITGIGKTGG